MVHLCFFARLRECVSLIHKQDYPSPDSTTFTIFEFFSMSNDMMEGGRQELCHFADPPLSSRREAEWIQRNPNILLPGHGVANRFSEFGFTGPNIPSQDDEWRSTYNFFN